MKTKGQKALIAWCLMIIASLASFSLHAEDTITRYGIYVSGYEVTSKNADTIKGKGIDGHIYYDVKSNTLVLDHASIIGHDSINVAIMSKKEDLNILVKGACKISDDQCIVSALYTNGSLTITGDTLTIELQDKYVVPEGESSINQISHHVHSMYATNLTLDGITINNNLKAVYSTTAFEAKNMIIKNSVITTELHGSADIREIYATTIICDSSLITSNYADEDGTRHCIIAKKGDFKHSQIYDITNTVTSCTTPLVGYIGLQIDTLSISNCDINLDFNNDRKSYAIYSKRMKIEDNSIVKITNSSNEKKYKNKDWRIGIYSTSLNINDSEIDILLKNSKEINGISVEEFQANRSNFSSDLTGDTCRAILASNLISITNAEGKFKAKAVYNASALNAKLISLDNVKFDIDLNDSGKKIEEYIDVVGIGATDSCVIYKSDLAMNLNGYRCCGVYNSNGGVIRNSEITLNGHAELDYTGIIIAKEEFDHSSYIANFSASNSAIANSASVIISTDSEQQINISGKKEESGIQANEFSSTNDILTINLNKHSDYKSASATGIRTKNGSFDNATISMTLSASESSVGIHSISSLSISNSRIQTESSNSGNTYGIYSDDLILDKCTLIEHGDSCTSYFGVLATKATLKEDSISIFAKGEKSAAISSDSCLFIKSEAELTGHSLAINKAAIKFSGYKNLYVWCNTDASSSGAKKWDETSVLNQYKYVKISMNDNSSDVKDPLASSESFYITDKTIYAINNDIQVYAINGDWIGQGQQVCVPNQGIYIVKTKDSFAKAIIR